MNTLQLIQYYASLLILQYVGKTRANATIQATAATMLLPQVSTQTITFSATPSSGVFFLNYNGTLTSSLTYNATASQVQTALQAISGLSSVTVSLSGLVYTVTFTGVIPPAILLTVIGNTTNETITVLETDLTLPLAVQQAYNLTGSNIAVGTQLDVLGKYAGVSRYGYSISGLPITLSDSDFQVLISMAVISNNSTSDLYTIQQNIYNFFAGDILVFDYANMQMSFLISATTVSNNVLQLFITEGLLPVPMAVSYSIIYNPTINNFFGFRTYEAPAYNSSPFNIYSNYQTNRPWLSYSMAVTV